MADNLPLIPGKRGGCAGDVRGVLRVVLRDRCARLPPLSAAAPRAALASSVPELLPRAVGAGDCGAGEAALRAERARRQCGAAANTPRPAADGTPPPLQRRDLVPHTQHNATGDAALWVRAVLSRESSARSPRGACFTSPTQLTPRSLCLSPQSMSMGDIVEPPPTLPPSPSPPTPRPETIVCVPASLDFVNFTLGRLYTREVRVVNVSAVEVRLSLRPPARRELDVELRGRLTVTSGASTELRVHFRPRDVRALHDELRVRVSVGRSLRIPIACYMESPTLEILVPNLASSALWCVVEGGVEETRGAVDDVLDLGARLLGDVHYARLLLRSDAAHASFFVITEESWISHSLEAVSSGAVVTGQFVLKPGSWRGGGGAVRGAAWCCARSAGLQTAALRVLCSTAVARPLFLLADSLYFHHSHVTIQAHEKDYDICSDDDPDCDYYVNLGTTFPGRALSASVLLVNHSPVPYLYYWSARAWGVCSCALEEGGGGDGLEAEEDYNELCVGAREAKEKRSRQEGVGSESVEVAATRAVRVEAARGSLGARCSATATVAVPAASLPLGVHRAVLMLVLRDIPKESFPPGYVPMVVSSSVTAGEPVPGLECRPREVCDVVCRQLEVWWQVSPLRFALEPQVLSLRHSRRVRELELVLRATQLFGGGEAQAVWGGVVDAGTVTLIEGQPVPTTLRLPLAPPVDQFPVTDVITLTADTGEWRAQCSLRRWCADRAPSLQPVITWLGVVPPGVPLSTLLTLNNDTHQDIYWWGYVVRWLGENPPKESCLEQMCEQCCERHCSCRLLRPTRGALADGDAASLQYAVHAPEKDGCACSLIAARRCAGDRSGAPRLRPACARASLLAYRVLAPRLTITVLQCLGGHDTCAGCELSAGCGGGAVVRAARALVCGRRSCCRLRLTNITPLATRVHWQPAPDGETQIRVMFIPEVFEVPGHTEVDIQMVIEARKVCDRRVWVRSATVLHAKPIYLLIDAAVSGVEVEVWLPLRDMSVCVRRTQREKFPWDPPIPTTFEEAFLWEDERRARRQENICRCKTWLQWVPPTPLMYRGSDTPPVDIVSSPPPLTRVCGCWPVARPELLPPAPLLITFHDLPLRTVETKHIGLRSACVLTARWRASVRLGALPKQRVVGADPWSCRVRPCGVSLSVSPARGVLGARDVSDLRLRAYADTWGLYHDQIIIMIDEHEPLVVDVWVRASGCPLQFALRPNDHYTEEPPALWVSEQDPKRTLRARNTSRASIAVHAYLVREHEHQANVYPFRVCIRLFDVMPRTCPCCHEDNNLASFPGEDGSHITYSIEMDTGVELYLAPDYGEQCSEHFMVEPQCQQVEAGASCEWNVSLREVEPTRSVPPAQPHALLLRIIPAEPQGAGWFREEPPPALARLRASPRAPRLQLSVQRVVARLCALLLPENDSMRIRKRIWLRNVGEGHLYVTLSVGEETATPPSPSALAARAADSALMVLAGDFLCEHRGPKWSMVTGEVRGDCRPACEGRGRGKRLNQIDLHLPPTCATEVCVEVSVRAAEVWPQAWSCGNETAAAVQSLMSLRADEPHQYTQPDSRRESFAPAYETLKTYTTEMHIYDDLDLLKTVPLILELELPSLYLEPPVIDLGYVCDEDTRKSYFSLSHSSHMETISVRVTWTGSEGFQLDPTFLVLPPHSRQNIYLLYTAKWSGAVAEGSVVVRAVGAAGRWCAARGTALARPSRDFKCHLSPHDFTDHCRPMPADRC